MVLRPIPELEKYRTENGLSFKALGEQLGVSGVTVYRWEKGERKPGKKFAPAISDLTKVPVLKLMGMDA